MSRVGDVAMLPRQPPVDQQHREHVRMDDARRARCCSYAPKAVAVLPECLASFLPATSRNLIAHAHSHAVTVLTRS